MIKDIYSKKKLTSSWFSLLQQTICHEFEKIEIDFHNEITMLFIDHFVLFWKL